MKTDIVPATSELLNKFYGRPPPRTARAVVAIRGEEIIGVGGTYLMDGKLIVFADLTDALRADKRALIRGIREVLRMAKSQRLPVYAVADPAIRNADKLLTHIGFKSEYHEVYQWHG